jgi:hypothetical protein
MKRIPGQRHIHFKEDRMYTYSQTTAVLKNADGISPGPRYLMTALVDSPRTGLATILDPDPANQMFGRAGFRIHGDNSAANHTASDGRIIAGHARDRIGIW